MVERSFECPVFFIEESADVMDVYNSLQSKSVFSLQSFDVVIQSLLHDCQIPHK